jgi:HlyD family secretion protein
MKKPVIVIFVVIIVLCAVGGLAVKYRMTAAGKTKTVTADAVVSRGDVSVEVVETGTIDAVKSVEVKSRVSGRLAKLYVDEGDFVKQGQLIAVIDPREAQLKVDQNQAQVSGAQSAVDRANIEIEQRRVTAKAALDQAKAQLVQLELQRKIQTRLTTNSITQAKKSLESAQKEFQKLKKTVHPNEITAAETTKAEAIANYSNAETEYARQQELIKKGYVSRRAVENAKLALDLAKARLASANANYDRIESQHELEISKSESDIDRLRAELDTANANKIQIKTKEEEYKSQVAAVALAKANLRDVEALQKTRDQSVASAKQLGSVLGDSMRELGETEIHSPISGVVTQKLVQEGELVASSNDFSTGTPVIRIEVRDAMLVKLTINEIDIAKLSLGMPAEVTVDALPEKKLKGRVSKIAPASTSVSSSSTEASSLTSEPVVKYNVEVRLVDREPRLKSGMSAKCKMVVVNHPNVLRVPVDYVGKKDDERFVMLAPDKKNPKSKATRVVVKVGDSTGAYTEILSGVKEGQKLVKPDYTGPDRKGVMQFGPDQPEEEQKK